MVPPYPLIVFDDVTESLNPRTTYDRLLFYNKLMIWIQEATRKDEITASQMSTAYEKVQCKIRERSPYEITIA